MGCVFCDIVAGRVPADIRYRDEEVIAFPDVNPKAPKHLLILPVAHIPSVAELGAEQSHLLERLVLVARELAGREGIADTGYRLTINNGGDAGQMVPHLHLHLLGGHRLSNQLC
ncbi:HIT domain-containing protein [Chloroflexota bacterium]